MQTMNGRRFDPVILSLLILTSSILTFAQTQTTGAIQGNVYEAGTQAPIPGAAISVTNEETGLIRTTLTNNEGIYYIGMLPPGLYTLSATRDGYENDRMSATNNFPTRLSKTNVVQPPPIILRKIGAPPATTAAVQQAVTPGGAGADSEVERLVNTINATRGGNFDRRQLNTLPLPGIRSFETLAFLLPGVAPPPQPTGNSVGPGIGAGIGTAGQFSVNGQRARSNNFTIDGSDNNDEDVGVRRQGFVSLSAQGIESLQEFQMATHLWDSGGGRNTGSQVNAISQSGTSLIHGSAFGFFNHDALNARDFFDYKSDKSQVYPLRARVPARFTGNAQDDLVPVKIVGTDGVARDVVQPNPSEGENPFQRYQAGFTIGGPISKKFFGPLAPEGQPKTFFFTAFERQEIRARQETHFSVPTVAQRGFLGSGASGFAITGLNLGANNPIFRPTFTAGDAIFSLFPFPNNPVGPYGENTFTEVLRANGEGTVFSLKFDHNFNLFGPEVRHTFTARYNFTQDEREIPAVGGAIFSGVEPRIGTHNLSLFLNSQFTARISNQIRGSFGRTRLRFTAIRDPFLAPSSLVLNDPLNSQFLLNRDTRLLNISCTDVPSLPVRPRQGCFNLPGIVGSRNAFATYFPQQINNGRIDGYQFPVIGVENNLGPVGQLIVHPFSPLGADSYLFPQGRVNNTYQIADTLTFFSGAHTFTLGADIRRTQLNSFLDRNFRPQIIFGGATDSTFSPDSRVSTLPVAAQGLSRLGDTPGFFSGADLAALGFPTGIFQALSIRSPDSTIGLRFWQQDFFFNDSWRVRRGLTLGYGVRYEYNTVPREANNRIEKTFDLSGLPAPDPAFVGSSLQNAFEATQNALKNFLDGRMTIYDPDRDNIGGHLSFAWDPLAGSPTQAGKTVIRGGAGIYYDVALGSVVSQSRNVFPTFIPFNLDASSYTANTLFGLYANFPEGFTRVYNPNVFALAVSGSASQFQGTGCTPTTSTTVFNCSLVKPGTLNQLSLPDFIVQPYLGRVLNPNAAGRPGSGGGLSFTLPDRGLRSPEVFHFNLQFERQLFNDFLLNVAWVGARGTMLTRFRTPNGGLNSPTSPLNILGFGTNPLLPPAQARPPLSAPGAQNPTRPIAALGAYTIFDSSASSTYHSLQTGVTKRFSHGWQMTAAYTWSHAIDDVSDVFDVAGAFNLPQDDRDLRAERGDANFDVRHRFTLSAIANVPFLGRFNDAKGAAGMLLGNWQFASISTYQTGQPFTVNTSFDVNSDGNLTDRINTLSGLSIFDDTQQKLAFSGNPTTLFAPIGRDGAVGRNTFRASGVAKTDFTLIKNFRVKEGQSVVFRAEAFNVFNRTHFGVPVRILEAPSFGRSVDTSLPGRQVQLALKYIF